MYSTQCSSQSHYNPHIRKKKKQSGPYKLMNCTVCVQLEYMYSLVNNRYLCIASKVPYTPSLSTE